MDKIFIDGLHARCILGVDAEERRERQDVIVSVALRADVRTAGASDCFEDAVDYRVIKKRILAMMEDSSFQLVEAMAEQVAGICLEHPKVLEVQVRVEKPTALRFARSVGVEITRGRGDLA